MRQPFRIHRSLGIALLLCLVTPSIATAASSGSNSPETIVDDSLVGTLTWSNPGNAVSSDNSYATAPGQGLSESSHYLKTTNFGFDISPEATINGVVVEIERSSSHGFDWKDSSIKLIKADTVQGNNKADTGTTWGSADEAIPYGGSTDTWGLALTASDINASTFGVAFSASTSGFFMFDTARIDHISITVYYTEAGASSSDSGGGGNATWLIQLRQQNGLDAQGNPLTSSSSSSSANEQPMHEAATVPNVTEGTMSSASSSSASVTLTQSKDWRWYSETDPAPEAWITSFRIRVCERVGRWFAAKPSSVLTSVLPRLNDRLKKRSGFACAAPTGEM